MNDIWEAYLYEDDSYLELDDSLWVQQYYDQLLILTAIASYNREEWLWKIRWKQAMMWERDMNIHMHCNAYDASVRWWKLFFEWKIQFEDFLKRVHNILLQGSEKVIGLIPWEFRKGTIFIGGESWEVDDAIFICPPAQSIHSGVSYIGDYIQTHVSEKWWDISQLSWEIHEMIAILHPFQDGNGRVARILAITFLEYFWIKDARGFTFVSEMLDNTNWGIDYEDTFDAENSMKISDEIRAKGVDKKYSQDGTSAYIWNYDMQLEDYLERLDIEKWAKNFARILHILESKNELIRVIIELFLKAKSLGGDHILIWKFINKVFGSTEHIVNNKGEQEIKIWKEMLNEVIPQIDGKLKKSSIKNLLILISFMKTGLEKVWIKIHLAESFFDKSSELWILWVDVVSERLQKKLLQVIEN